MRDSFLNLAKNKITTKNTKFKIRSLSVFLSALSVLSGKKNYADPQSTSLHSRIHSGNVHARHPRLLRFQIVDKSIFEIWPE